MAVLYVTEQNSVLRKTGDRLYLEKDGQVLLDVPCLKLDAVLVFGNVQVTTQALVEMLDHGIELALLSSRGQLRGQLTPPKAKNVPLRMRQYAVAGSEREALAFAREIVAAKIASSAAVLRRFRANHPDALAEAAVDDVARFEEAAGAARSLETLRGVEGAAAARYFGSFGALVPAELGFAGRNRRPPRDPVNALLSFGYVLAGNELQSLLDAIGFDPYLGFFHAVEYGRPSLALDLLEEFRAPLVDRFSAGLLNLRALGPDDFSPTAEGGVVLRKEALRRYFTAYEKEMTTPFAAGAGAGEKEEVSYRQLFRRQAERLAGALVRGEPYEAFRLPC